MQHPPRPFAPADGINDVRLFFTRNPGIRGPGGAPAVDAAIYFQPEIGASATPDAESLARFLSPAALAAAPVFNASSVHPSWGWHVYEGYTDGLKQDHVYAVAGAGVTALSYVDYAAAAGLAQYGQYRALFEGFSAHAFDWVGAVVMWKSSSPWPSLRGALTDWYGARSGGYWGARSALGRGPVAVIFDPQSAQLVVVNKGIADAGAVNVTAQW